MTTVSANLYTCTVAPCRAPSRERVFEAHGRLGFCSGVRDIEKIQELQVRD